MKRISALFLSVVLAFYAAVGFAQVQESDKADKKQRVVMVNLTRPIAVNQAKQSEARFSELTAEAVEFGLGEVTVNGSVAYKAMPDKTIRSQITWHSLTMQNGDKTVSEALTSPLESKVRTPDKSQVEAGTEMKAVGDLDQLTKALMRLKEKAEKKTAVKEVEEKVEKNTLAPTNVSSGSGDGYDYGTGDNTFKTTVVDKSSETEECKDRFVSLGDMKVFKQYKTVYYEDGTKVSETSCSPGSAYFEILSKAGDCTYRYDMTTAKAIVQEQLYYMDGESEVNIGSCKDSDVVYPLTETREGCEPIIDIANGKVFPQSHLAYTVGDSLIEYATECRAIDGDPLPLVEEYCDPKFENDFVNGQSYLRSKLFYTDTDGEKIYVNQCSRSANFSWPHLHNTDTCGWTHDDENMVSIQNANTYISTGESMFGDVEIESCHEVDRVSYAFVGTEKRVKSFGPGTYTWNVPKNVSSFEFFAVAGGGNGGSYSFSSGTRWSGRGGLPGEHILQSVTNVTDTYKMIMVIGANENDTTITIQDGDTVKNQWTLAHGARGGKISASGGTFNASFNHILETDAENGYTDIQMGKFGISTSADFPKAANGQDMSPITGGIGGTGFGAGGGGTPYTNSHTTTTPGGDGLPGIVKIEYSVNKYMRADGSFYVPGDAE